VSPGGDSRSLVARRAKMPQISVLAGRPRIVDETSQAVSPGLQFGLQFTTVQCRSGRTVRRRWSSLNRSELPRPELLMRLGFTPFRGSNPRASAAHGPLPRTPGRGLSRVLGPIVAVQVAVAVSSDPKVPGPSARWHPSSGVWRHGYSARLSSGAQTLDPAAPHVGRQRRGRWQQSRSSLSRATGSGCRSALSGCCRARALRHGSSAA